MTSRSPAFLAGIVLLMALGLAFSLACKVVPATLDPALDPNLATRMLGESRQALSLNFFNEADRYFHKGVSHLQTRARLHGVFQRWDEAITPEQHAHAEGASSAEILPWLKLASRADPRNIDAFLVAAFWAETELHRHDLAMEILNEAQRANPAEYRIPLEKGRLSIRTRQFADAHAVLGCALRLQSHAPAAAAPDRQFALDRAEILVFLGFLSELDNQRAEAIEAFNNALAIFPERSYIKERVAILEAGREPQDSARRLLEALTRQWAHNACHEDDDHDH